MIFEHVLIVSQGIKILPSEFEGKRLEIPAGQKSEQANTAALLLVNKQTHSEAKRVLYSRNTFPFSFSIGIVESLNASAFRGFLDSMAGESLACIRRSAFLPAFLVALGPALEGGAGTGTN